MPEDDGDIVRALGFVALHASYLEEQIEYLVALLTPVKIYSKGWQISDKIIHAKKAIRKLNEEEFTALLSDLDTCLDIFQDRNDLFHGRIYGGINCPETLSSSRADVPDREVFPSELYQLATEMDDFRTAIYRPMIFDLPNAIEEYLNDNT